MENKYQSIGLFIDGGYFAKINEVLERELSLNIHVTSLMKFIREQIADISQENDVIFSHKHLREVQKDGNVTVIEKGIAKSHFILDILQFLIQTFCLLGFAPGIPKRKRNITLQLKLAVVPLTVIHSMTEIRPFLTAWFLVQNRTRKVLLIT